MCGRFVVAGAASDLVEMFDVDRVADEMPPPSFNVAPTDRVPVVIDTVPKGADPDDEPVRRLEAARWGLVPPWAKDIAVGVTAFNARIETAAEKPHFLSFTGVSVCRCPALLSCVICCLLAALWWHLAKK